MKSRGRRAGIPELDFVRPRPLASDGLTVTHLDEKGENFRVYEFATLPVDRLLQMELATLFAAELDGGGRWRSIPTSWEIWLCLQNLCRFLTEFDGVTSVSSISPAIWSQWDLAQGNTQGGRKRVTKVGRILAASGRLPAETVSLTERRRPKPEGAEQSYEDEELREIRSAASGIFRRAEERIQTNLDHLKAYRSGRFLEGTDDWFLGRELEVLAATGDVSVTVSEAGMRNVSGTPRRVLKGRAAGQTWQRLFLSGAEAFALVVLIALDNGWNETSINELQVPGRVPAGDGVTIYRVELEKRRRRPPHRYESRNLEDNGPRSSGRIITRAIAVTQPARDFLELQGEPADRLVVWHVKSGLLTAHRPSLIRLGLEDSGPGVSFRSITGLQVSTRRIRRTVNVTDKRAPNQNTPDTHDGVYTSRDIRAFKAAVATIAAGAQAAVDHSRAVLAARVQDVDTLGGDETPTASCSGFHSSPFGAPGSPCPASFFLCLGCPNATVMPRHLGKLDYLRTIVGSLRSVLPLDLWESDWKAHFERLSDLRQNYFTDAQWFAALGRLSDEDKQSMQNLLQGLYDS